MNIVVIVKNGYVNEVIVPDTSVNVLVLDYDDPMGAPTMQLGEDEISVDTLVTVKHKAEPSRIQTVVNQLEAAMADLDDSKHSDKARALIQAAIRAANEEKA